MAKIAISLPEKTLKQIERVRRRSGESRSAFMRRAVQGLIREDQEQDAISRYVKGYRRKPETSEEVFSAESTVPTAFEDAPWDRKS